MDVPKTVMRIRINKNKHENGKVRRTVMYSGLGLAVAPEESEAVDAERTEVQGKVIVAYSSVCCSASVFSELDGAEASVVLPDDEAPDEDSLLVGF